MDEQSTTTATALRHTHGKALSIGGFVAAGAIAAGAIAFAIGGGGGKAPAHGMDMNGMAMPTQTATQGGTPVATTDARIKNFAFSPSTITVKADATVVWTNDDPIEHDVTFDGGAIGSATLDHNDTFAHAFTTPGTYHYICSIHPFMHGTVIVTG